MKTVFPRNENDFKIKFISFEIVLIRFGNDVCETFYARTLYDKYF